MSVIVFTQNRGNVVMPKLPSPWLYGFWTYAYDNGTWYWVSQQSRSGENVVKGWREIDNRMVPKEHRAYALVAG